MRHRPRVGRLRRKGLRGGCDTGHRPWIRLPRRAGRESVRSFPAMFLLVTGASGAGKSTVRREVAPRLSPEVECIELCDVAAVPVVPDKVWRQRATEAVVHRALELQAHGRHLLLSGDPVAAGEVLAAPSSVGLDGVAVCLLDVSPDIQAARLARRGDDPCYCPTTRPSPSGCVAMPAIPVTCRMCSARMGGSDALGPVERNRSHRRELEHGGAGHFAADPGPGRRRGPDVVRPCCAATRPSCILQAVKRDRTSRIR